MSGLKCRASVAGSTVGMSKGCPVRATVETTASESASIHVAAYPRAASATAGSRWWTAATPSDSRFSEKRQTAQPSDSTRTMRSATVGKRREYSVDASANACNVSQSVRSRSLSRSRASPDPAIVAPRSAWTAFNLSM